MTNYATYPESQEEKSGICYIDGKLPIFQIIHFFLPHFLPGNVSNMGK